MLRISTFLVLLLVMNTGFAQNPSLQPNQNPNYKISEEKYTRYKDSLLVNSNTTIHETYKTYDWYESKNERRNERRDNRRQRSSYGYNQYGYNNYGWNNSYNNRLGYNNSWGNIHNPWFIPSIGFRTGNWFFRF